MKSQFLKLYYCSAVSLLLTGCAYSPGYAQYEFSTPFSKQCLYLTRPFIDTKGITHTQYIFPAGYYRPLYNDSNGTYYTAPNTIVMKTFVTENLSGGGVYLSKQNEAYGWSYPKLGTYGPITVNGVEKDTLPPTILFKLPSNFFNMMQFKSC